MSKRAFPRPLLAFPPFFSALALAPGTKLPQKSSKENVERT